jgi:hypothetical protein
VRRRADQRVMGCMWKVTEVKKIEGQRYYLRKKQQWWCHLPVLMMETGAKAQ